MSKFAHFMGHVGLMGLQAVAQYSDFVPGRYKPLALASGMVAQAVLGLVNHNAPKAS